MKKILLILIALLFSLPLTSHAQSTLITGGTGWGTSTKGDLLVGTTSPLRYTRLPIGTTGFVLTVVNGTPTWVASSGGTGGGTWATTTSSVPGQAINYPLSNTDIVTVGGNSTSTAPFSFDPNLGQMNIGNAVPPQLNAFGSGFYQINVSKNSNDGVGGGIWNTSTGAQAFTGFFLNGNLTPTTGIGALATYYAGIVHANSNWNGVPLGFGALPANGAAFYNTDGSIIIGSATSTGLIDFYAGAGSFAGGTPDMRLNSQGMFGIGTSTPYAPLSIVGNGGAVAEKFAATSTTGISYFLGPTGVGTTTPNTATNSQLTIRNNSNTNLINAYNTAGTSMFSISNAGTVTANASFVTPSTSQSGSTFSCVNSISCIFSNPNSGAGANAVVQGSTAVNGFLILRSTNGVGTSDNVRIQVGNAGGTEALRAVTTGNIGIGQTAPISKLDVTATSSVSSFHVFSVNTPTTAGNATSSAFLIDSSGHESASTTPPVLSSCGGTPGINGSDTYGTVNVGGVAGACTVTFNIAYKYRPTCVVTSESGSVVNAFSYTVTTSALTVSETGLGGTVFDYICMGR